MSRVYATANREQNLSLKTKDPGVEVALSHWFCIVTGRGLHVSGLMLNSKLAKKLGHNDFKATDGWLSQWRYTLG
jgi:hypothetical protein